ncbi:unnamed protein product, partial [Polarella glacialis]
MYGCTRQVPRTSEDGLGPQLSHLFHPFLLAPFQAGFRCSFPNRCARLAWIVRCWRLVSEKEKTNRMYEAGAGEKIPGNTTLSFDVELLDFKETDDPEDAEGLDMEGLNDMNFDEDDDGDLDGYGRKDIGPGGEDPDGSYTWERCGQEIIVTSPLPDDAGKK